jgi:hypothetical protein
MDISSLRMLEELFSTLDKPFTALLIQPLLFDIKTY